MRHPAIRALSLALLGLAFLLPAQAFAAGRVLSVEGTPRVERARGGSEELKRNDPIHIGDTIRTGQGRVKLMFEDNSLMTLDRNTDIKISEYLYSPAEQKRESMIDVFSGRVKSLVGRFLSSQSDFQVRTPTAVAGVRGTHFMIDVDEDSTVTVFDGEVAVQDANGVEQLLGQGMQIRSGMQGHIGRPIQLTRQALQRLERELEVRGQSELQQQSGGQIDLQENLRDAMPESLGGVAAPPPVDDSGNLLGDFGDAPPAAAPPVNLQSVDPSSLGELRLRFRNVEVD